MNFVVVIFMSLGANYDVRIIFIIFVVRLMPRFASEAYSSWG